jgi:hypothetical protein
MPVTFLLMDIVDFYPNTDTASGRITVGLYSPPDLRRVMLAFSDVIHGTLYQWTPEGLVRVADRYGIGLCHSGEVCDLNWADVEQRVLHELEVQGIKPSFWSRMVDDYFMALTGTEQQKLTVIQAFRTADSKRPITVYRSEQSVDYLDITVYKGTRFRSSGKVDTKLFTKPSNTELHLPYSSFHPRSTMIGIMEGQHRRSLIASSSTENHTATMLEKYQGYSTRGYPREHLNRILLQETTRKKAVFQWQRKQAMKPIQKERHIVIALKLPFTHRSVQIANKISVSKLQKQIEHSCPVLHRASMGRLVVAHKSTMNMLERTRPKGLIKGYAGGSGLP